MLLLGHKTCSDVVILGFMEEHKADMGLEAADASELLADAVVGLDID